MRDLRLPRELEQECRIVEWTSRGIHHVSMNAAVLSGSKAAFPEFQQLVLSHEALPAIAVDPCGIDSGRRATRSVVDWRCRNRESTAIRFVAVDRTRNPQIRGEGEVLFRPRH